MTHNGSRHTFDNRDSLFVREGRGYVAVKTSPRAHSRHKAFNNRNVPYFNKKTGEALNLLGSHRSRSFLDPLQFNPPDHTQRFLQEDDSSSRVHPSAHRICKQKGVPCPPAWNWLAYFSEGAWWVRGAENKHITKLVEMSSNPVQFYASRGQGDGLQPLL